MKMGLFLWLSFILIAGIFFSCRKEYSCEGCIGNNKPPIAIAGPDTVITLPMDSILLDGSNSSDPDGKISEWQWKKISGPASFSIVSAVKERTVAKNLTVGYYQFELKVTDDKGASAKDTVTITVDAITTANHPPVANAGADQTITLPISTVTLDGSSSTDPDNNITSYQWTKISGPTSLSIASSNAVQTQAANLIEGVYQFELKVTDAGGLSSKDTVQVTVINANTSCSSGTQTACDGSTRQLICAQLIPVGSLSEPRAPDAGAAGHKVVFAGGWKQAFSCCFQCGEFTVGSSVVDIYDVTTNSWESHQLSKARLIGASISAGNKIFFAGGTSWIINSTEEKDESYDNVDIYNVAANTWEVSHLSKERESIAAATIGNKIFFAGGSYYTGNILPNQIWNVSDAVDIYDLSTNNWSTHKLSIARAGINAVTIGDKIYFIGGYTYGNGTDVSDVVDIYNNSTGIWSTSDLATVVASLAPPAGMGVVNKFYIAGDNIIFWSGQNQVGIRNLTTNTTSVTCMSSYKPAYYVSSKVFFEDGTNQVDIYDPATNVWSLGKTNQAIPSGIEYSVIQLNNSLYFGGGYAGKNGAECIFSNKVYKLEF